MMTWVKRHRLVLIALVVLAAIVAAVAWSRTRPPKVTVAEAYQGELTLRIAASGLVEARSSDLGFRGSGRLSELRVKEGDTVQRSDILAWLEPVGATPDMLGVADAIQAPYDGTVVEIYRRIGSVVAPGEAVLRVVAAEKPWVTAFIESEDAVHLRLGQKLQCRAGGYLSESWEIAVRAIGREAVPRQGLMGSSRQVRVRCEATGPSFPLAPGTEVDIDGELPLAGNVVLIPAAAVVHEGTQDHVWVVEGSSVRRREVEVGANNFDLIEIRSGIQAGDKVVVHGKTGLRDGQRVEVTEMPPMTSPDTE
jgi:multidrug efflux pump subunit AcrA (membrane-fusion protein)